MAILNQQVVILMKSRLLKKVMHNMIWKYLQSFLSKLINDTKSISFSLGST